VDLGDVRVELALAEAVESAILAHRGPRE